MSAEAAVRADLEPQRLSALVQAGWQFEHKLDGAGQVRQINGMRRSPCGRYVDGIRVKNRMDVAGRRWDRADGREVWRREGRLAEIVDALLDLSETS